MNGVFQRLRLVFDDDDDDDGDDDGGDGGVGVIPNFERCVSTPPIGFRLALTADQNGSGQGTTW